MTKWQNKMAKTIKPVVRNTEVSPADTDEIKEAIEEAFDASPLSTSTDIEMNIHTEEPIVEPILEDSFESKVEPEIEETNVIEEVEPFTESIPVDNPVIEEIIEPEMETESVIEEIVDPEPVVEPEIVEPEPVVEPEIVIPRVIETSIIHTGTRITGNIDSDDILIFHADLTGNINCTQKLTAYGNIKGNVTADVVEYHEVNQIGFISVNSDCIIEDNKTIIQGNITCKKLNNCGTVHGNIECSEICQLNETAVVVGDIHTKQLSIKSGAIIKGKITMNTSDFNK